MEFGITIDEQNSSYSCYMIYRNGMKVTLSTDLNEYIGRLTTMTLEYKGVFEQWIFDSNTFEIKNYLKMRENEI